jgi:hypothetical protein
MIESAAPSDRVVVLNACFSDAIGDAHENKTRLCSQELTRSTISDR